MKKMWFLLLIVVIALSQYRNALAGALCNPGGCASGICRAPLNEDEKAMAQSYGMYGVCIGAGESQVNGALVSVKLPKLIPIQCDWNQHSVTTVWNTSVCLDNQLDGWGKWFKDP